MAAIESWISSHCIGTNLIIVPFFAEAKATNYCYQAIAQLCAFDSPFYRLMSEIAMQYQLRALGGRMFCKDCWGDKES
jgi:hypothetical protein